MNAGPVAELAGVRVVLGQAVVIDDLDLALERGQFTALLGANGSGKTTLVRALLGLAPPAAGEVRLFGHPLGAFRRWGRVGYVPQRFGAPSAVPATVEEVVLTGRIPVARRLRGYGPADRQAVAAVLEELGLSDLRRRRIAELSGGQQQRVLIARALVNRPDLLVLDEPVSSVDLDSQRLFAGLLRALSAGETTVLLVAHALGALQPLVHRTLVLERGRIAYDGPPRPEDEEDSAHHHAPADHFAGGLPGRL